MEVCLPLELRSLGQQSTSSQGQGVYSLLVNHRDDSEWCHSHFHSLIPGCANCGYGIKTAPWLEHRKPPGIQSPSPETLPATWTCHLSFQKAVLSIHCSRMAGENGKTGESHRCGPIATHHWPSSFIRSNIMWISMMVGKVFCKFTSILAKTYAEKANPYPKISVYLVRTKCCFFHGGSGPM